MCEEGRILVFEGSQGPPLGWSWAEGACELVIVSSKECQLGEFD